MSPLIIIIIALIPLAARWYLSGLRYQQRWNQREAELAAECRWKELNEHFEAALKSRRPMWRLVRWLNSPGWLEARYALNLGQQGRDEEALMWAERGVRKSAKRSTEPGKAFHRVPKFCENWVDTMKPEPQSCKPAHVIPYRTHRT
jgi:hypothetical protein